MAKLRNIYIPRFQGQKREIWINWDNGRYQSIIITGDSPEEVRDSFKDICELIDDEIKEGFI